jgi:3,4-dihydroxy 2-butanone 4-phosphate synthase / GTP cyclohydrolase II
MQSHSGPFVLERDDLVNHDAERGRRVRQAVSAVAAGRPIVVVGGNDPHADAHLMFAAEHATPTLLAFMIRHTSGFICVGLTADDCDRLRLPPMYPTYGDSALASYTVTVDAAHGISTGISAADRTRSIRLLASATTTPDDLSRPGHVVPCRAVHRAFSRDAGAADTAVDLARLAGLRPAGVYAAIVSERYPGELCRRRELAEFADRHDLSLVTIDDLRGAVRDETSPPPAIT